VTQNPSNGNVLFSAENYQSSEKRAIAPIKALEEEGMVRSGGERGKEELGRWICNIFPSFNRGTEK